MINSEVIMSPKFTEVYSPLKAKLDVSKQTITIEYTKYILEEPGIAEHFKGIGNDLSSYIEDGFKKEKKIL